MNRVLLGYGESGFGFDFDTAQFEVVVPPDGAGDAGDGPFEELLIDSVPLVDRSRGRRVLVIVSDLTRPTGTREFLPRLLPQLEGAARVRFLFATGIHRPLDAEDKARLVGGDLCRAYAMLDHEPESGFTYVGDTSFGNRVEINSQVFEDDLVVLTGGIGFHYFAGFSGGRKSLVPGVASRACIEFNHLLVLDPDGRGRDPRVRVASMDHNPVHEDMVEAARLAGLDLFVYNTILDAGRRVRKVYAGHWIEAHRRGAADYFRDHSVRLADRRPLAIVSCGGFPRDINMIQAHKALEFAQYAVDPGGTIILLAECREGLGHPSFLPWFRYSDLDDFERRLRAAYEVYGQTAHSLLSKARRYRLICVSSLDAGTIRCMGMEPATNLADALGRIPSGVADAPGYILPFGADILPVLA